MGFRPIVNDILRQPPSEERTTNANEVADEIEAFLRHKSQDKRKQNEVDNELEHILRSLKNNVYQFANAVVSLSGYPESNVEGAEVYKEVYGGKVVPVEQMPKDRKANRKRKREDKYPG